jgi:hypothetical protein
LSQHYYGDQKNSFGYKYDISVGKFGGKIQYRLSRELTSDTYDQNDLGFQRRNNEIQNQVSFDYNIYKPFGKFLSFRSGLNIEYNQLFKPREFTEFSIGADAHTTFVNRFNIFFFTRYKPLGEKDYYEPRVEGRYFKLQESFSIFSGFGTDERRKLAMRGGARYEKIFSTFQQTEYGFDVTPRYRMNDRFNFSLGAEYRQRKNDIGYVDDDGVDSVYFGMRQSPTWIYNVNANYIFTNTMSLGFDLRHYWSRVRYEDQYYFLNQDGSLSPTDRDLMKDNINYNSFTIDMVFKWNFAPGSWLTAVWKNIVDADCLMFNNYFNNVENMFKENQVNSVSLKVLYYIDYQMVKKALTVPSTDR